MQGYEGLKPGFTRVSFAFYTSTKEAQFVLDAIEIVAEYGHRFLPLYHFDWKTGAWNFIHNENLKLTCTGALGDALRSCREKVARVLLQCRPLFNCSGSVSEISAPPYADYLRVARDIAKALPDYRLSKYSLPEDIDPRLVTFMV